MNAERTNSQQREIHQQLKAKLGAPCMPFGAVAPEPFSSANYQGVLSKLQQLCAVKASGILSGRHGTGKSYLIGRLLKALPEKSYKSMLLTHTTMSGSDLIRGICHKLGVEPQLWRSNNVRAIEGALGELRERWPVFVIEEAQNLTAPALEELRLLTCGNADTGPSFSLILVGDESLLPRLQMGVNKALLSRIGYSLKLQPLSAEESSQYMETRLIQAGIHVPLFEPAAMQIVIQASEGVPRLINHLSQRALENALSDGQETIAPEHVQSALERMPWFTQRG